MKVLIAVDGSELANQAARFVGRLLSSKVDDLLLYYSPPSFQLASKTPVPESVLKKAASALAEGVFEDATYYLSPEIRSVTSTLTSSSLPAHGIVEAATQSDADLVVVGSKSAKRRFPFVLGSTARTVVHHTGKPVMVVRGEFKPNDEPIKVTIACDENRWADATGLLREFSWPENTEATLLHVTEALSGEFLDAVASRGMSNVENSAALVSEYQASVDKRMQTSADAMVQLQEHAPEIIRNASIDVTQGEVVEKLLHHVESENVDLLVLSSRRLGVIGRMLGSVTESLLSRCPCSLLIVHGDQVPSEAHATTSNVKKQPVG